MTTQVFQSCKTQFPCSDKGFNQNLYNCCTQNAVTSDEYFKCRTLVNMECKNSNQTFNQLVDVISTSVKNNKKSLIAVYIVPVLFFILFMIVWLIFSQKK